MALLPGLRATAAVEGKQRSLPRLSLLCLAALATGVVAAVAVSTRVPPGDKPESPPVVRANPATSITPQAGATDSAGPLVFRREATAVPENDLAARRVADAGRTTVALHPDDASYLREDSQGRHIGEPLDPDDESAMPASGDVSHIGDYLDPLDD